MSNRRPDQDKLILVYINGVGTHRYYLSDDGRHYSHYTDGKPIEIDCRVTQVSRQFWEWVIEYAATGEPVREEP